VIDDIDESGWARAVMLRVGKGGIVLSRGYDIRSSAPVVPQFESGVEFHLPRHRLEWMLGTARILKLDAVTIEGRKGGEVVLRAGDLGLGMPEVRSSIGSTDRDFRLTFWADDLRKLMPGDSSATSSATAASSTGSGPRRTPSRRRCRRRGMW
jgi:hypothetical protein